MKKGSKILAAAGLSLVGASCAAMGAGAFFYRLCLTQKVDKSKVFAAPHNRPTDVPASTVGQDREWLWRPAHGGENDIFRGGTLSERNSFEESVERPLGHTLPRIYGSCGGNG